MQHNSPMAVKRTEKRMLSFLRRQNPFMMEHIANLKVAPRLRRMTELLAKRINHE